jgi:anti-sigma-K factor RskA
MHPDLFEAIAARTADVTLAETTNVIALQRAVSRWRVSTFLAGMAAAALLAVAIGDRMLPSANPHEFVAVLSMNGSAPAFVATVNLDAQTLVIRRVTDPAPADRSYELWAVPTGGMPKSLGLLEQARYTADLTLEPANLTLAVSLEPKGGSITGAPTGPIVFTGTLIAGN